ncbi:hypothetical protein [Paludisphaera rhizosphaerae]|uniref:hypothetical protein n=1 Tax=Paludisphaera rhizosphaerae TaxID=2711216 RepID=UPI0013EBF868|nr:hypothetical protein [Paludisphaera rhizosphaerae]
MAVAPGRTSNPRVSQGVKGLIEAESAWEPTADVVFGLNRWRTALRDDMSRELDDPRWPRALVGVGLTHLAAFLVCQWLAEPVSRRDLRYLGIWFIELVAVFVVMRKLAGRHWIRRCASINLVAKLWTTFLILSFNVVSLNNLVGIEHPWFKPVWGTLSTFLFASLAWLFSPLFFIPAVQMWATGLLMAKFDPYAYAIYGASWCLALCGLAANIRRTRSV